jgi:c-di-GMP phosphodiesterase
LTRIRLAGVRIALDDFGTGYSSLSYLSELPADVIKLDRTFLNRDLPESAAIIESVVGLAHRLGLQVLAEGVETQEQSDGLMNLNCDQFQGYFFNRPMSANAVASLLESLEPVPALSNR